MKETATLEVLKGIGDKTKKIFERAGICQVGDLLHDYPRAYDKYDEIKQLGGLNDQEVEAVSGTLDCEVTVKRVRSLQITSTRIRCGGNILYLSWYHMPYLKNSLKRGTAYVFRGKIIKKKQQMFMEQPAVFTLSEYEKLRGSMQPIYTIREGLSNKLQVKAVRQALNEITLEQEYLPLAIRKEWNLSEYNFSLEQIHFPENMDQLILARKRLVFDEFFLFILALRNLKNQREEIYHSLQIVKNEVTDQVMAGLEYELTKAQKKAWKEIEADMIGPKAMARLIQGDVGSGKTILAVLALLLTAVNGYQGTLMVPTEVLAVQHYESLCRLLEKQGLPFQAVLLTGSMTAKQKRQAYEKIADGRVQVIVGTHALIQEKVEYHSLGLVITDEQHRFGVKQREALTAKGAFPHTMVMSATPIPRTLAVILYGDLDISSIDELPANRLPIKNCVVNTGYRKTAYKFIQKEVESGRQAYVICPMVDESEVIEAENVTAYAEQLRQALPDAICVESLHGKMKPKEKNAVMDRFLQNDIQVLVSTTVVEVGVNVPNATVMMIENAERFGLAQLHQLRGRVGRGKHQSYCIMVQASDSKRTKERLEILNHSNDGFYIAGEDLKLRGPGDLFGIRQSGLLDFKLGDVFQDASILQSASEAVSKILKKDELLEGKEHRLLRERMTRYLYSDFGKLNL